MFFLVLVLVFTFTNFKLFEFSDTILDKGVLESLEGQVGGHAFFSGITYLSFCF